MWTLDQVTFRRLVWLYIACWACSIAFIGHEVLAPEWTLFGSDFDALVVRHFGPDDIFGADQSVDGPLRMFIGIGCLGLAWNFASMFGLLRFKRWARTGIWTSVLVLLLLLIAVFGSRPSYSTPLGDMLAAIDSGLLGAILLLSYARGLGAAWFAPSSSRIEE